MTPVHRDPDTRLRRPIPPSKIQDGMLAVSLGDADGHLLAICAEAVNPSTRPKVSRYDPATDRFVSGPLEGVLFQVLRNEDPELRLPVLLTPEHVISCDDPLALAGRMLESAEPEVEAARALRRELVEGALRLGRIDSQAAYEDAHARLAQAVSNLDQRLEHRRFLGNGTWGLEDAVAFTFAIRLDLVYYELYKASIGLLRDFPSLHAHARDLFEHPAFYETTSVDAIRIQHYSAEPVLNPKAILPLGGRPDLDAPHFRAERFADRPSSAAGTEETQASRRGDGEWVRGVSRERKWIASEGPYPAAEDRYHLYAPFNCPWSHRALLARAVKGLEKTVGASILYFRRDPERGWQFNPGIPGCTPDLAEGKRFLIELYEMAHSSERSAPVLWDTHTKTVVSNESADILRMFDQSFTQYAARDLDLYPEPYREEIDRLNALIYHRINNGAYKAGFAGSQSAYERAFERYFRAMDWVDQRLSEAEWLAGTPQPSEADLRLFPTAFRHDAVYFTRFKLNRSRLGDWPRIARWLERMLDVPGVAGASNLDHARNGYFGRTGNAVVPAGPVPLGLSPKNFTPDIWLNQADPGQTHEE
ncbi:MAG: glutathione S-transferase C-terminal domain-containing protein [Myxococcota bacterium]